MSRTNSPPDPRAVFDYIVVGAGAAGCVVANRLSEDPDVSVCLVEAGPEDKSFFIGLPAGFTKVVGDPRYTWNFQTEPTRFTANRPISLIQGKVLGGGTSVNGMAYNRGQRKDFDDWAAAGNPGWSYADLLPLFKDIEHREGGDPDYRGKNGPLSITNVQWNDRLCAAFVDGVIETGTPRNVDSNAGRQEGVGFSQVSILKGRRVSAASAFLQPVRQRRNLFVLTNTVATRVMFQDKRAIGIRYHRDGAETEIGARREIILSCGAINTPRLLQISGVGDSALLKKIGVAAVHDLPGVGSNLQDHYLVRIVTRGKGFTSINQLARAPRLWWQVARWLLGRPSLLGLPVALVHCFMKSAPGEGEADIQGIFTPASQTQGRGGRLDRYAGMTCAVWQHRPLSRGYVQARSQSVFDAPLVQPNYLEHEQDRRVLIAACRRIRRILSSEALRPFVDAELLPGGDVQSDDEWLDFAYRHGSTVFHPVGTAKMGPASDPMSVVDHTLRVHGLECLRVIDASVMPTLTSANTAAATMVIGEKGARLIGSGESAAKADTPTDLSAGAPSRS